MSLVGKLTVAILPDASSFAPTASRAIAAGMRRETRAVARVGTSVGDAFGEAMGDAAGSTFGSSITDQVRRSTQSMSSLGAPIGRAVGDEAGDTAGRQLMEGINTQVQQSVGRLRDSNGRFIGRNVGEPAGEEAGRQLVDGINDQVRQSGASLRDGSGRFVGRQVGEGAGPAAGLAMSAGIETDMNGRVTWRDKLGMWIGQGAGVVAAAAFAAVFTSQIGELVDFDKQRAIVNSLLGDDAVLEDYASDSMKTLVGRYGVSAETAGQTMFALFSAQFDQNTIDLVADASVKIAVTAGDRNMADEIASQAQNLLKLYADEAGGPMAVLDIVAKGGSTASTDAAGILSGMVGVDSIANSLGVSLDDLVGSMATLNNTGATMPMVNTMMASAMNELATSSSNVNTVFEQLTGTSAKDFLIAGGSMTDMVQILSEGSKTLGYDLTSVFSSSEADRFLFGLSSKLPDFKANVDGLSDSTGELQAQFDRASKSVGFLFWAAVGKVRVGLQNLWDAVRPVTLAMLLWVNTMLDRVGPALRAARDWITETVGSIRDFLAENGMLTPVLAGLATTIGLLLLPVVITFVGWLVSLAVAAATAAVSMLTLYGPILLGAAIVGAFVGAIVWAYQNVGWFRDAVDDARDVIVNRVWPALQEVAAWLASTFVAAWQSVSSFVVDTLWPALQEIASWLADVFVVAWEAVSAFVADTLLPALQDMGGWFESDFMPVLEDLGGHIQDLWTDMSEFGTAVATVATQVWSVLGPAIAAAVGWFGGNLVPILQLAWTFISTVFTPMWNTLAVGVQVAWGLIQIAVQAAWLFIQGIFLLIGAGIDILGILFDGLTILVTAGWTAIQNGISDAWTVIQVAWSAMQTTWDALVTAYQVGKDNLLGFISALQTGFEDAFGAIRDAVQWPIDKVNDLIDAIGRIDFPDPPGWVSGAANFLGLGNSSEGRLVTRPMVSWLGEGGLPEVVLPLTKPARMKALLSGPAGAIVAANLPRQSSSNLPDAWSGGPAAGGGGQIVIQGYPMDVAYEMASNRLSRKATLTVRRG